MNAILIVDDRVINRDLLRSLLTHLGHDLIEAADGPTALDIVRQIKPRLVITDLLMPGMDGYSLVRAIRDEPALSATPVIFYSAYFNEQEVRPLAEACGVSHVVAKGGDPQILLDAVLQSLGEEAPAPVAVGADTFTREHLGSLNAKLVESIRNLEESEARIRAMAESAPVGIVQGTTDGRAVYVNARLAEIVQRPVAALLGDGWQCCLSPEHLPGSIDLISGVAEHDVAHDCRSRVIVDDGTARHLNLNLRLVRDDDREPTGFVATVDDLTAFVEAQEQLVEEQRRHTVEAKRQVAERLSSLIRLAGGIAHDFNNIFGVCLNYHEFVNDTVIAAMQARTVENAVGRDILADLEKIGTATQRAAGLTQHLLAFSGRKVAEVEILDLNQVCRESVDLLRATLDPRIQVVTRLEPNLRAVTADPGQLTQILFNLLRNAAEAIPEAGIITITTTTHDLPETPDHPTGDRPRLGEYVMLAIQDTGRGMSAEIADHAVEPFFTTKPQGQGVGLGLASVHGIVTQHDGHFAIESTVGVGTTIDILLRAAAQQTPADKPLTPPGGRETVLVVDDEDGLCDITARILRKAGYAVLTANGGLQALAVVGADTTRIDLLLTDVRMPGMTGPELATRLLTIRPDTRIMFMSGYSDAFRPGDTDQPYDALLLAKPFNQAELLTTVRTHLDAAVTQPRR